MKYKSETEARIKNRLKRSYLDVNTQLEHFAIISYKVPIEKIQHLIPKPFKLWTFTENGNEYALVSAVPFKDNDFSFYRISRFFKLFCRAPFKIRLSWRGVRRFSGTGILFLPEKY